MSFDPKLMFVQSGAGKSSTLKSLMTLTRAAGPYLAIEILMPGGSVIALLAWLYRRRMQSRQGTST